MRNRRLSLFALEALEVDKLHEEKIQTEKQGQFDQIYQGIKQEVEQKEKQAEASEEQNPDEAELNEGSEMESEDATDVTDVDSDSAQTSLESFVCHHIQSDEYRIAQEEVFTKDNLISAGKYLGEKTLDGLKYMKDIGFQYGPVLLKHVYKGVLFAVNKTVKAIVQGSVSINNYVKRRINSYENLQVKIAKLREAVDMLEEPKEDSDRMYANEIVINQLKIGSNYDVINNVKVAQQFFESYFTSFERNVLNNVVATRNLVKAVINEEVVEPSSITTEKFAMSGLVKHVLTGYKPTVSQVEAYSYRYILPGDVSFIAWLPSISLSKRSDVLTAYQNSKFFLGMDTSASTTKETIPLLSLSEIKTCLDVLDKICQYGMSLEKPFGRVIKLRNSIRGTLNVYMRFLLKAQNKISIEQSMADYIAVKVGYMDRTHITGALYVNDYMVRVINNSLSYLKDSVQAHS